MRKLILNLAVSLDGFIEGPNGEIDWCLTDQDYGMSDFLKKIDCIFIGRKSYEVLNKTSNNPFLDKYFFVFSNTMSKQGNNIHLLKGGVDEEIRQIKSEKGKDVWLFGGASLTTYLLNAKLIDEFQLSVHPVLLGNGKKLWEKIQSKVHLQLLKIIPYSTGLVQMHYMPIY